MPFGSKYALTVSIKGWRSWFFQALVRLLGYPLYVGDRVRTYYAMKHVNPCPGDFILDAGCNIGVYCLEMALKGANVVGIDISKEGIMKALRAAKAVGLSQKIFLLLADVCNPPFRDSVFDKILCVDVLEHVRNDVKALHEFRRILKNSGNIIIHVPKEGQTYIFLRGKINYRDFGHVREGYRFENIKSKLEEAQLAIAEYKGTFKIFGGFAWEINYMLRGSKLALLLVPLLYGLSKLDYLLGDRDNGRGLLIVAKPHE
jgi:ubiquinone/menaquinone biosynthesis C-methylase UbiE